MEVRLFRDWQYVTIVNRAWNMNQSMEIFRFRALHNDDDSLIISDLIENHMPCTLTLPNCSLSICGALYSHGLRFSNSVKLCRTERRTTPIPIQSPSLDR